MADLVGQPVSQGTLLTVTQTCAAQLAATEDGIAQALRQAPVAQADETGLDAQDRRIWLHRAATPELTSAFPHDKRGQAARQAAEALPEFQGIALHDRWEASQPFERGDHAFCHAHPLRERQRAMDQDQAAWAKEMKTRFLDLTEQVDQAKAAGQEALAPDQITHFQTPYRGIVAQALPPSLTAPPTSAPPTRGRQKQSKTKSGLDRFDRSQTETLRFRTDCRVPVDNPLAELDLRMIKVKQKISGALRSPEGPG